MQPFAFLTEQGRARRMRPMAFAALEHYDLDVQRLRLVENETNCTFRVDTTQGRTYALRISLPDLRTIAETQAEIAWLDALTRETDIAVVRPIPTRSGEYVVVADARGVPEPRHCVVFEWIQGRPLADRPTRENFQRLGALLARLHQHGAQYQPPDPAVIRPLSSVNPMMDEDMLLREDTAALFPPEGYERLVEMRSAVERELAWLFSRDEPPRILHGDFHWWNVMVERGKLRPIDFEDLCRGYPVQDLAISTYYASHGKHEQAFREGVREGYEGIAPWPEAYPGQLELHMVHRALDLFNFVLGSTFRHDKELLGRFLERIQGQHWEVFQVWKASFDERYYR